MYLKIVWKHKIILVELNGIVKVLHSCHTFISGIAERFAKKTNQ